MVVVLPVFLLLILLSTTTLQKELTYPTKREVRQTIIIFKSAKRTVGDIGDRSLEKSKNLEYVCQSRSTPYIGDKLIPGM